MEVTTTYQGTVRRFGLGRLTMTAVLAGTLATSLLMVEAGSAATSKTAGSAMISTSKTSRLGTFLVSGKTLYALDKNDCNAKCLVAWPALLLPKGVTKATAGAGVKSSQLGTVKAAGGLQVTYGGKPLYFFFKDKAPGQVNGNKVKDKWGVWSVVVTVKPKSGGTTPTTAPSGGGTSF